MNRPCAGRGAFEISDGYHRLFSLRSGRASLSKDHLIEETMSKFCYSDILIKFSGKSLL